MRSSRAAAATAAARPGTETVIVSKNVLGQHLDSAGAESRGERLR